MHATQRKAHTKLAAATLSSSEMTVFRRLINEATGRKSPTSPPPLELLVSFARLEAAGKIKSHFNEQGQPVFEIRNAARRPRKVRSKLNKRSVNR